MENGVTLHFTDIHEIMALGLDVGKGKDMYHEHRVLVVLIQDESYGALGANASTNNLKKSTPDQPEIINESEV